MKREYITPVMAIEEFRPDESIATGCNRAPGDDPSPQKIQCYFYNHKVSWGSCTNRNVTKTVFMQGNSNCNIQATTSGSIVAGSGVTKTTYDFVDGGSGWGDHSSHYETAYHWDTHWIREGQIDAIDGTGQIVTYFNS